MPTLAGGLLNRLRPPADAGSDADLLARFVSGRDAEAFTELVRRHGGMVLAVCRRALGDGPDAEDAHQIAFMALARDAGRIANSHALAGWLHRVALLTARKLAGRTHRRKPEPFLTEPATPMPTSHENDLRAVIDAELLALPEKFRAVAVLCLVEGRTNTEAAALLGIPKGTVDSRLSTARAKLKERLLRRGVAAAALLTAEQVLTGDTQAAAGRAAALAADVASVALDYAAGVPAAGSEHLIHTANGVRPMTNPIKWLAAVLFTTALLGGGGTGIYMAAAGEKEKPPADVKADPKAPPKPPDRVGELTTDKFPTAKPADKPATAVKTADEAFAALNKEFTVQLQGATFDELLDHLHTLTGTPARIDTPAFVRRGWAEDEIKQIRDKQLSIKHSAPMTAGDVLREALGQVSSASFNDGGPTKRVSYRIKGNTILIVPEYQPPSIPGSGVTGDPVVNNSPTNLLEEMYGEPVTVRYKNRPLAEVIEDLQERTGANIVLNANAKPDQPHTVTANFNDARLLTVLKVVGDMCDLKPVVVDNVFYLTTPSKAEQLQKEVNRDLFGTPTPPPAAKPLK